jgi:beta-lactamase regulating signal transducer with metallopeptidase domain
MSWLPELHGLASTVFERLLYCAIQGSVLTLAVSFILRLKARKSSRTVFAIWFSALIASALMPLITIDLHGNAGRQPSQAALTLPISIVLWILFGWLALACASLLRVAVGLLHVHQLKKNCRQLQVEQMGSEVAGIREAFSRGRRVELLISDRVEVPTAVGFFKPAVVIPEWMTEQGADDELKHVLLHELTHLERRDDWTNLIQKIVKALLFFNPGVWWMERELSLHREVACDDAVLAHTLSPRKYAECLARVAEKSFLRRQLAMAQAAVSRVRQMTFRVSRILDPDRPTSNRLWKPAVPGVVTLALLSGISVAHAPELVRVDDGRGSVAAIHAANNTTQGAASPASADPMPDARAWTARLQTDSIDGVRKNVAESRPQRPAKRLSEPKTPVVRAKHDRRPPPIMAAYGPPEAETKAMASRPGEFMLVVETRQTITAGSNGFEVSVQQLRWLVPVSQIQKSIPGKI